MDMGMGLGH